MAKGGGPAWALCCLSCLWPVLVTRSQHINAVEFERLKKVCVRSPEGDFPPARQPNDLGVTLGPILRGEAFSELSPRVLSENPWIIVFDNFLSEAELLDIDEHMFRRRELEFSKSSADRSGSSARHSQSAFCIGECAESHFIRAVEQRAGAIVQTPTENIDFIQAVRYKKGMYYREHHDNRDSFSHLPCGTRTFTFFVYISNVTEGGGTKFPRLGITVEPQRGRAVLFSNTLDEDPSQSDDRTHHEALPVVQGEKRGLNVWVYRYNYKAFWQQGCTGIMFADMLAGQVAPDPVKKAPAGGQQVALLFESRLAGTAHIFWVDPGTKKEVKMPDLLPGADVSLNSYPGHVFHVRVAGSNKLVRRYKVTETATQTVIVYKAKKKQQAEEL